MLHRNIESTSNLLWFQEAEGLARWKKITQIFYFAVFSDLKAIGSQAASDQTQVIGLLARQTNNTPLAYLAQPLG